MPFLYSTRALGVEVDNTMYMAKQINIFTKSCIFQINTMYKIREYVFEEAAKMMVGGGGRERERARGGGREKERERYIGSDSVYEGDRDGCRKWQCVKVSMMVIDIGI